MAKMTWMKMLIMRQQHSQPAADHCPPAIDTEATTTTTTMGRQKVAHGRNCFPGENFVAARERHLQIAQDEEGEEVERRPRRRQVEDQKVRAPDLVARDEGQGESANRQQASDELKARERPIENDSTTPDERRRQRRNGKPDIEQNNQQQQQQRQIIDGKRERRAEPGETEKTKELIARLVLAELPELVQADKVVAATRPHERVRPGRIASMSECDPAAPKASRRPDRDQDQEASRPVESESFYCADTTRAQNHSRNREASHSGASVRGPSRSNRWSPSRTSTSGTASSAGRLFNKIAWAAAKSPSGGDRAGLSAGAVLVCLLASLLAQQVGCPGGPTIVVAAAAAARQSFSAQPELRYLVAAGQQVRLPCLVSHRQGECAWLGPGGKIVSSASKRYVFARLPSDGDCSLVIKRADVANDDGKWQCQALALGDQEDTAPLIQSRLSELIVLTPPERPQIKDLSPGTNKLILEERKERNVTCEIRGGNPAPQVEWYLDGKPLGQNAETSIVVTDRPNQEEPKEQQRVVQSRLLLSQVRRAMNGKNLTCVGVHQTQNQSASIELDVQYVPIASVQQREITLVEGSPFSVLCQVDANPPATHVYWRLVNQAGSAHEKAQQPSRGLFSSAPATQDREAVVTQKAGPLLEISQITRLYNRNTFECLAQNSLGISNATDVRLNILYPPQAVNTTEPTHVLVGTNNLQLQCMFDGNPQPEIKWHYTDPLSRSLSALVIDNTRDWEGSAGSSPSSSSSQQLAKPKTLYQQQFLTIRNVTYRNEGDYFCEARNTINGHANLVRSSIISMDVYGEPQFLVKSPVHAKVVQGAHSMISLTFCSDPPPTRVYWQFGSIRLEVARSLSQQPYMNPKDPSQLAPAHATKRFQTQYLRPLQSQPGNQFAKVPTCFEAPLLLSEPEVSDQRDYTLFVQNEQGLASGYVRLRVTSPLSPALMITSAFVFICGLFLCSLLCLFVFKKRHQLMERRRAAGPNGQTGSANGNSTRNNNKRGSGATRKDKNLLVANGGELGVAASQNGKAAAAGATNGQTNGNGAAANGQQHQGQTNGIVNGLGNGLANNASNPSSMLADDSQHEPTGHNHHHHQTLGGLRSMASSDTSCNDQKQLLASSDRNSSVGSAGGSSASGVVEINTGHHHHHHHHHLGSHTNHGAIMTNSSTNSTSDRSTANSTPSPMNHISVDDELHLNGTYQATEPITRGAELSPRGGISAPSAHHLGGPGALIYANIEYSQNVNEQPDEGTTMTRRQADDRSLDSSSGNFMRQGSGESQRQVANQQLQQHQAAGSPTGTHRSSVGATIAMMNSLAAAQAAAAAMASSPTGNGPATTGVLNGAINQQLMANSANRQVRKPGPPKPPKPSIQQRSRFYQQQAAAAAANGGLVMIGNSQMGLQNSGGGAEQQNNLEADGNNHDLAVEYSRLAFPARAEL